MKYEEKEVNVVLINGSEIKVKQYCKREDDKELVLLSNTLYDNEHKIYHKYYDCYEDWPADSYIEFEKWKVASKNNLEGFYECARCQERHYREKNPNAAVTGYGFHYYFE